MIDVDLHPSLPVYLSDAPARKCRSRRPRCTRSIIGLAKPSEEGCRDRPAGISDRRRRRVGPGPGWGRVLAFYFGQQGPAGQSPIRPPQIPTQIEGLRRRSGPETCGLCRAGAASCFKWTPSSSHMALRVVGNRTGRERSRNTEDSKPPRGPSGGMFCLKWVLACS